MRRRTAADLVGERETHVGPGQTGKNSVLLRGHFLNILLVRFPLPPDLLALHLASPPCALPAAAEGWVNASPAPSVRP
jgi:hypothetical protein